MHKSELQEHGKEEACRMGARSSHPAIVVMLTGRGGPHRPGSGVLMRLLLLRLMRGRGRGTRVRSSEVLVGGRLHKREHRG